MDRNKVKNGENGRGVLNGRWSVEVALSDSGLATEFDRARFSPVILDVVQFLKDNKDELQSVDILEVVNMP